MHHESCSINRHGLHHKSLRIKHQGIHNSFLRHPLQSQRRQCIFTLIKRCHDDTSLKIQHRRSTLLTLGNLQRIHLPGADNLHTLHKGILNLRKGKHGSFLHALEIESVKDLIGDKYRIPLLQLLQKGPFLIHDFSLLSDCSKREKQHHSY